jgi:Fur family transcriptional regulator, ferric uptake regulator
MQEHEAQFRDYLQKQGLRLTRSRALILNTAFAVHEHFDAETLHDLVKSDKVSLATVYRTLPLLVGAGLIQLAVHSEGRDRFEHILGHPQHVHWLCENCKAVIESDLSALLPAIKNEAKALKFDIDQISLSIKGLCWKCRRNENESQ